MGHLLEADHGGKLDQLEMYLTGICKDDRLDIVIRLKALEILELRALGWNNNPQLESFYQDKISRFQEVNERTSSSQGSKIVHETSRNGSSLTFRNSAEDISPDPNIQEQECLDVKLGGETTKLFIFSDHNELSKEAKTILFQHFASKSASGCPGVQYSRETLMSLATTSAGSQKPTCWERITSNLPEIAKKE